MEAEGKNKFPSSEQKPRTGNITGKERDELVVEN
jgi:hypothetical protein